MSTLAKDAYSFLEKLSFARTSGSAEETKAAEMIAARARELGYSPVIEEFPVSRELPVHAVFSMTEPEEVSYEVTGLIGCADADSLDAEFYYLRYMDEITLKNVKGRFVLLNSRPGEKEYERLVKAGAVGFMLLNGTMLDKREETDLDTNRFRDMWTKYGRLPALTIREIDAIDLLRRKPKRVHIELKHEKVESTSRNVIVEIPGTDRAEEVIITGAHYDSTEFSRGSWDNGAGVVHLLALLDYLRDHKSRRTLKVIFFGSEEIGLMGSKAYAQAHEAELEGVRCMINTDVGGSLLGYAMLITTGVPDAESYVNALRCETDYCARLYSGIVSSDSAVFADYGIPGISMCQFTPEGAGYMHTRHDNFDRISEEVLGEEIRFFTYMVDKLANISVFPFARCIPKNLRDKVIDYFGKDFCRTAKQTEFAEDPDVRRPFF